MANTSSSFSLLDLDFANNKESLKTFLRSQSQFKDYDFDGSNLSVLMDLLAYNTYKNSFYYNMLISEAFLDSAQLKDSIVSHAKELNYVPRSRNSSKAQVKVDFTATGENAPYIIPKGSPFTALVKNKAFTFTLPETLTVSSANSSYSFTSYIYEGIYLQDVYIVSDPGEFPKYRITNKNVDTRSITVMVYEDGSEDGTTFTLKETLLDLDYQTPIYFLQAVGAGYYEVLFGDNFFGKKPKLGSTVVISYRISSGSEANGCKNFSVDFDPTGSNELTNTPTLTVLQNSSDGLQEQDNESIRIYAPRYFATQQRAVSSDDYASLILGKFAGTINDVVVYGGETVEPRKYGRVIIAIKPNIGTIAPDFVKEEVKTYLLKYVSLPTRIELVNPVYFYLQVNTTIQYDVSSTTKTANEIKGVVANAIEAYSTANLERFDNDFRYSRFVNSIDESDPAITSNDTAVKLIKRITPTTNFYHTEEIKFNNQFHPGRLGYSGHPIVTSSPFYYITDDGVEYPFSYIRDNGAGKLEVFTNINNQEVILNSNLGEVDYTNGIVSVKKLLTSSYGDYISIYVIPLKRDVIINKNNILFIDASDVSISAIGTLN